MIRTFGAAVGAGVAIGLGGAVYLSVDHPIAGSLLFAVGLFTTFSLGFSLFTGKVGYALEKDGKYRLDLLLIWLGNLVGTALTGFLLRQTRLIHLAERAEALSGVKTGDTPLSLLILGSFCGMLMYIAAECYRTLEYPPGKYIAVFLCVSVFILAGFEHSIANMFYFTMGNTWSGAALVHLAAVTLGNATGAILLHSLRRGIRL